MGQASPGPQGSPKTDLARIIGLILGVATTAVTTYLQVTTKEVIYTVIGAVILAILVLGPWLFPLPPSNFASLEQVVSTRIKSSWPLLLFTVLTLAATSCVTWMVVTGMPLLNIVVAAILIALSSLCLIAVAVMTIIGLVRRKSSGQGTRLTINWLLLKLSAKWMLYIIVFLIFLILAVSTSLLYTLRVSSVSNTAAYPGKTPLPHITPSSTDTIPVPAVTKQIVTVNTIIYLTSPTITPKTPLSIPCSVNCVSRLDVVLKSVVFENSHSDLLFTFQLSNREPNICNLAVNVLRLRGEQDTLYDGGGQIFRVSQLDAGQVLTLTANFSLVPSPELPYLFSLVLSCQSNMPMIYEKQTLIFDSYHATHPQPNPIAIEPIKAAVSSVVAFIGSPLGRWVSFFVLLVISLGILNWWRKPSPFGVLTSTPEVTTRRVERRWEEEEVFSSSIVLGAKRSLRRRLLSRSTISSQELIELAWRTGFDLKGGKFDLIFKKGGQVYIRARKGSPSIRLQRGAYDDIGATFNRAVPLRDGDIINVDERDIAVFHKDFVS